MIIPGPVLSLMCEVWIEREREGKEGPTNFGQSGWKAGVTFYCHSLRGDPGEREVLRGGGVRFQ